MADDYSIYHFDLYRLSDVHDFFLIGGSDIYADRRTVLFIEWPDRISPHYHSTLDIYISVCADGQGRDIEVVDRER
jgi:tRNA A37 threonylcarbamoyladenosine biosynthesis protein TsaE